ncbi:MAG: oligosaccharide flippase family protein [Gammaproteobacteria bacterium]
MIRKLKHIPDGLKHTLLYGCSIALMKGVSLLMLPFIAHHLSTDEYGRLEVITTLAIIGSILVGMGLENTLFRFAGASQDQKERTRLASEIFGLTLIIGSVSWFLGWYASEYMASLIPGNPSPYEVKLVISILALEGAISIPLGWFRMQNRVFHFFFATTGRALTQAILVLVLLSAGRSVEGVLEAGLIAAAAQAIVLAYFHIQDTGLSLSRETGTRSFIYSLPIVGSGLVAFSLNGLDRWILADYASLADVAQFGVAAKFSLAMILLMQPFGMWWSPRRFEVLHQAEGHQKVANFIVVGITLALIISVLVSLASPLLINWLLPESYASSAQYVVGLVLVMLLKEISDLINIGCFKGKTTNTQLFINATGSVVGIVCMVWLTPLYAVWGIIVSLILAQTLRVLMFFIASQHFLPLNYPLRSLLLFTSISAGWLIFSTQTITLTQQILTIFAASITLLSAAIYLKLTPVPALIQKKTMDKKVKLNKVVSR